jgi:hypothetical protein
MERIEDTELGGGILIGMRRQGVCGINVGHARPRNQDMYSNKQLILGERCPQIAIEKVLDVVPLGLWRCGDTRNIWRSSFQPAAFEWIWELHWTSWAFQCWFITWLSLILCIYWSKVFSLTSRNVEPHVILQHITQKWCWLRLKIDLLLTKGHSKRITIYLKNRPPSALHISPRKTQTALHAINPLVHWLKQGNPIVSSAHE